MPVHASSPPHPRDPALDGLRGVAVLMVFVFHYGGGLTSSHAAVRLLGYLTQTGWIGVVLFFALSGLLITGGLWDSLHPSTDLSSRPTLPDSSSRRTPTDLSSQPEAASPLTLSSRPEARSAGVERPAFVLVLCNFYARRALRILPLYYAVLIAAAIVAVLCGCATAMLHPLTIYALFLQNLPHLSQVVIRNASPLPLYHLWSLAVEEQFYLLWPAMLLLARSRRTALHLCLWSFAASFAFRIIVYGLPSLAFARSQQLFDVFLLTQCGAIVLGAAVALVLRSQAISARTLHRWALAAMIVSVATYLFSSLFCGSLLLSAPMQYMLGLPAVSVAAAALLILLLRPGIARTLTSLQPLPWLGRISYGFYVLHILLQPLYDRIGTHLTHANAGMAYQTVRFAVALPLSVLAAWLSYHLLERPFLRAKRRFPLQPSLPHRAFQR